MNTLLQNKKMILLAMFMSLATGYLFGQNSYVVVASTESIDFGARPNGCWASSRGFTLRNNTGMYTYITSVTCDNDFFVIDGPIPTNGSSIMMYPTGVTSYQVSTGTSPNLGATTGTITFVFSHEQTLTISLSATVYNALEPDVWELAREVTFPYSETIYTEPLHNIYTLPGTNTDDKDAVFKMTIDEETCLSAQMSLSDNGKLALYDESFGGQAAPGNNNAIAVGTNVLKECGFESGVIDESDWINDSLHPWEITRSQAQEGRFSIRTTKLETYLSTSTIEMRYTAPTDASISFYWRLNYDNWGCTGRFYVDGVAQNFTIRDAFWQRKECALTEGEHVLKWVMEYRENCYQNAFLYLDNVQITNRGSYISQLFLHSGTYYIVTSSSSENYQINFDTETPPTPVAAFNPTPLDNGDYYGIINLEWEFGDYTDEYQLLYGESNPPTDVLVDWTDNLSNIQEVNTEAGKTYYWRVNERNDTGETLGEIWSFNHHGSITPDSNNIIYVKLNGTGDGSSWENACSDLQAVIDCAAAITDNQPVIWVAKGTYLTGSEQEINGRLCGLLGHGGVKLYGGFNGDEPADFDLSQRDLENNATILDAAGQCFVIGTLSGGWDGFVMQHGGEAGVYVYDGTSTVQNCKILYSEGTGIFVAGGRLYCYNNEVSHHAKDGICQDNYWYYVDIRDCTISYNGRYGVFGNMCVRCKICNNGNGFRIRSSLGGALIGCLVANNNGFGTDCAYIVSSTIVNNGTGIARCGFYMDLVLVNSIIWGNEQQWEAGLWNSFYPLMITNNAIQGGVGDNNGVFPCINLEGRDVVNGVQPGFAHPSSGIGSDYSDGDWTLLDTSPCINMGMENLEHIPNVLSSLFCTYTGFTVALDYLDVDADGNPRVQQSRIDLGAIETSYNKPEYYYSIRPDANNIIYVKADGQGDGSSWDNATSDLREAMETSILYEPVATIWVAHGTYTVSDFPFQVKEHLKMYGGFEGTEPADYELNQRDLANHASILDGDNVRRVLYQRTPLDEGINAVINGFTLCNGQADEGAGAYLLANTTLSNCVLQNNNTSGNNDCKGGGIYANKAIIEHCNVANNTSYQGGGIYSNESIIENCHVTSNTAEKGGGIYALNSQIIQSHIGNNQASDLGGGVYAYMTDLLQCNIVKNEGDGVYSKIDNRNEYNHLYNTILWGNDENSIQYSSSISLYNTVLNHCAVEGLQSNANDNIPLSHDNTGGFGPFFVDPVVETGVSDSVGDWQLQSASICINVGSNDIPNMTLPVNDYNNAPRIQCGQVDMGVYETPFEPACVEMDIRRATINMGETYDFYGTPLSESGIYDRRWTVGYCDSIVQLNLRVVQQQIHYVTESGAGIMDGSSWENAMDGNTVLESGYTRLADALSQAHTDDYFWIANGTYHPCGDSDVSKHFTLNEGVSVYGGFAGTETTLEDRDLENNMTIFSGELQGDDDETNNTDGIFITAPTNAMWSLNATLDGVILTKGYTTSHQGAALFVNENTAITLNQCRVQYNREGGIRNFGVLEITDSDLSYNNTQELGESYVSYTSGYGINRNAGALCNMDQGIVALNNCTFQSNYSNNNGAIFNSGIMEINVSVFEDNTADRYGAIASPGKMKIRNTTFNNNRSDHYIAVMLVLDSLELVNCEVTNNKSNYYTSTHYPTGGSQNFASKRTSGIEAWGHCYVDNCNFINNDAGTCDGGALSIIGTAEIKNTNFIGNTGTRPWRDPQTGGNIGSVVLNEQTDGGALYVEGSAIATDCVFDGNSGFDGSTIGVKGSLILERCKIVNSFSAVNLHWGVIKNAGELIVNNSLIANNSNKLIYQRDGIHTIFNNTTIVNTNDPLFRFQNFNNKTSIIDFNNCILSGYSEDWIENVWNCQYELNMNHTLVSQLMSGTEGNENDPLFVNPTTYLGYDENVDPLEFDWTMQPGSPCINAGDVTLWDFGPDAIDLAGEPRVKGGQIDMGAYEYGVTYVITAQANPAESGIVTGAGTYDQGATATLTATANTGYVFVDWTENGEEVSTETTYSFTVTGDRSLQANFVLATLEQVVTLNVGWNWWSTYLDIDLADLETALGSNGMAIKSQYYIDSYSQQYGLWMGNVGDIAPEQMYKICVNQSCSITLTGTVVNPADYPITIKPGSNWIGFPLQNEMSLQAAFVNFTPANGDVIRTANGHSSYSSVFGWIGDVDTFQPGQGYVYISNASGDKTLVFPSSASK